MWTLQADGPSGRAVRLKEQSSPCRMYTFTYLM